MDEGVPESTALKTTDANVPEMDDEDTCTWCKTPLNKPLPDHHIYCIFHSGIETFGLAITKPANIFWPTDYCHQPEVEIPSGVMRWGLFACLAAIYFFTTWQVLFLSHWFFVRGTQGLFPTATQTILYGMVALPIASIAYQLLSRLCHYIGGKLALQCIAFPEVETHKTFYPVKCVFCEKDLPPDPPIPSPGAFDEYLPLPRFIKKEDVRQCPHCSLPVTPKFPSTTDDPWRHVWWVLLATLITLVAGLLQPYSWTTVLLGIEIWGLAYTGIHTWGISEASWTLFPYSTFETQTENLKYHQGVIGNTLGIPLGIFFTVTAGLIWSPQTPLCWTGIAGFFLGVVVIRWYIFQASVAFEIFLRAYRIFRPSASQPSKA